MQKLNTSLTPVSEANQTPIPINRDQIISEKLQKIDQGTHKALEAVELKTTQSFKGLVFSLRSSQASWIFSFDYPIAFDFISLK